MHTAKAHSQPHPISRRPQQRAAETKEPLQLRIPTIVKRRFKAHAALRGMEPNELFVEIWNDYEASHSGRIVPKEDSSR
jgi:hypothetical protein